MEKEKKQLEIELRSEEFQEIVQQSPRWLIRSGIFLIIGLVILLLAGSYFFRYPDVIQTDIVVSIENKAFPGDSLLTSVNRQTQIAGLINLPAKQARKVAVGQKVNIKLEDFPSPEYGFLKGRVKRISYLPKNGNYLVEVEMAQDLTTSFDIPLKFSHEMKGSAEIITEDLRLIQRFINPLKSLLKHRVSQSK